MQALDTNDTHQAARQRIEPQNKDLMGMARAAALLPSWSRSIRANQSGVYLSALKGRGMEYDESRPYQAGDDVRTLDWRVTARTGKPHTKVFREERERPVYICCDFSASMFFATRGVFKSVQAARAAALIGWKAQQSSDRVGGLVFSESEHSELPPQSGKPAAMRLVKKLVTAGEFRSDVSPDTTQRPFAKAIARLHRMVKPGSLIFLFSDFRDCDDTSESDIAALARHNDVTAVFIYDAFEATLPRASGAGLVTQAGKEFIVSFGEKNRDEQYAHHFEQRRARLAQLTRDYRMLFAELATDDDPLSVMQGVLGR